MDNDDIEHKFRTEITNELLSAQLSCEKIQILFSQISNEFQTTINALTTSPSKPRLRKKRLKTIKGIEGKKKKKSIFGKVYRVQSINEGKKRTGYRVHTKYIDVNHCIGPYATLEEATAIKQLIQSNLKEFNSNDPDVEAKVEKRLTELKLEYDKIYPPLEMVRLVHNKKP